MTAKGRRKPKSSPRTKRGSRRNIDRNVPRGKLIALEGIDGAGTSTQAELLHEWLKSRNIPAVLTCEPADGRPIGQLIRDALEEKQDAPLPEVLALLFAADRIEHVKNVIEPALKAGEVVITDRYRLSSIVYQSLELPLKWVRSINEFAPPADLTVVIDVGVNTSLKRLKARGEKKEIFEKKSLLEKLRRKYKDRRLHKGEGKVVVIDGELGMEEVFENVLSEASAVVKISS